MTSLRFLIFTLPLLCTGVHAVAEDWVWFEAESPAATNFKPATPERDKGKDVLSGGMWMMANAGWTETPFLEYDVQVPADGSYNLSVRKFWKHGPFRWRFDDQPWQEVSKDVTLLDSEELRKFTCANWVTAGRADLSAGTRRIRIELTDPKSLAAFDAFVLTKGMFSPRGKLKPDAPWPEPAPGFFTFSNSKTVLDPSPIDLRFLNEKVAGERGFISVKGGQFVQDGKAVRFVGTNAGPDVANMTSAELSQLAKFLARKGINLVRFHGPLCVPSGPNAGAVDPKRVGNVQRLVAALKAEGIYTHLSIYFQHWFDPSESAKLPGYEKGQMPFAIHFYNPVWQAMYHDWWRALLTTVNPHTGLALKDDPAVMGLEIINEDSFFFWTFDYKRIPLVQMEPLEKMFAGWLSTEYGSLEKAFAAWDTKHERDSVAEARAGFVPLWTLSSRRNQRDRDTARFLAETQRRFYDEQYRFLREEIGAKAPICGSNWRTASTPVLGALDKWTQAGADFFDHHGYVGAWKKNIGGEFLMGPGDQYADRSLARWDADAPDKKPVIDLPFLPMEIDGKPSMVSEYAYYLGYNAFRAEGPLITAALFGQAGITAPLFFSLDSVPTWVGKINSSHFMQTPTDLAQYPAKALTLRQGMIRPAKVVASVRINVEEMKDLKGNPFTDLSSGDANRSGEGPGPGSNGLVDPRLYVAGKVTAAFSDQQPIYEHEDVKKFIPVEGVLSGANQEVEWQHQRGLFLLKTPQSQGVAGFLKAAGTVPLPDLNVDWGLDFGVAWAVAMDGKPIATSDKILLQVMSEERNHGFATEGEPKRTIKSTGSTPVEVRKLAGTISFTRADAAALTVTALDVNGVPTQTLGTADRITLLPDALYYLIEKK